MIPGISASAERQIITSETFSGGDIAELTGRATDCLLGGTPFTWATQDSLSSKIGIVSGVCARTSGVAQRRCAFDIGLYDVYAHCIISSVPTGAALLCPQVRATSIGNSPQASSFRLDVNTDGTVNLKAVIVGVSTTLASGTFSAGDDLGLRVWGFNPTNAQLVKNGVVLATVTDNTVPLSTIFRFQPQGNCVFAIDNLVIETA